MSEFFTLFGSMLVFRPYVFIPLSLFLYFGVREAGWRRTTAWLGVGFCVAFLSEYSSVRTGFPFGWYYYVKLPTAHREIWLSNVPFMDSISFTFLSYWAFSAARAVIGEPVWRTNTHWRLPLRTVLFGAFLMMVADLVIDPVALRGEKWFLGTIFGYPKWGPYFGITIENFLGWFCVGSCIMGLMVSLEWLWGLHWPPAKKEAEPYGAWLYIAIVAFNTGIAAYIGEWKLFLCDLLITLPIYFLILFRQKVLFPNLRPLRIR